MLVILNASHFHRIKYYNIHTCCLLLLYVICDSHMKGISHLKKEYLAIREIN